MAISTPVRIRKVPQPKVRIRVLPKIIPADGEAATIEIGTVTTLAAGSDATVVNSGTENAAVFDFGLPRGDSGVVQSIIAGTNVTVDDTDPANPIVSAGGGDAADVTFTPAGNVAATNVQAAIEELDDEKQPVDAELTSWAGVTRASGFDTFAATPSSANLRSLLTDETGTGAAVFGTDPTITITATGSTTARSLANRFADIVNPLDFDVVGDGSADDAADFQACVTAAAGRVIWIDGLTIRIPTGNEITVPSTGLHLAGRGTIVYEGTGSLFKAGTFTTTTYPFTATAAQTVFTATDDYEGAYVEVYQNDVLRPFWSNEITHDSDEITATFLNGGATLSDDVEIRVTRATAAGLDAFSQVIVGAGVEIQTTQVNAGRAFQLAWPDSGYAPGRQYISFVMEQGSVIRGSDGNKGFTNAIWLHGAYNGRFSGDIYGVGANLIPAGGVTTDTLCQWGVYITGEWTTSDFRFYGGSIGYYCNSFGSLFSTVEGFMATNFVFLNVGYMAYWEARTNEVGLYLDAKGCHVNTYHGIVWTRQVSEVMLNGNLFFQGPGSTKPFFRYVEIEGGKEHVISDNVFRSFVTGANTGAVVARTGCHGLRGHNNVIVAADSTSVAFGFNAQSGSYDCVWGPNTYENVDQAAIVAAGSDRIGLLTLGDVFITPPGVTNPRYSMAGNDWWMDEKWLVLSNSVAQSVANNTSVLWAFTEGNNPEGVVTAANVVTSPAWATRARFKGRFRYVANTTGQRGVRVVNNTLGQETAAKVYNVAAAEETTTLDFDITLSITGGHAYFVYLFQNSGGALNLSPSELQVLFS